MKKMIQIYFFMGALALMGVTLSPAQAESSDFSGSVVQLNEYRSFAWWPLPPLHGAMRHEDFRDDVQSAIADTLEDKDIDEAFLSLNPDFYIAYYAQVRGSIDGAVLLTWPGSKKIGMEYPGGYWGPVYVPTAGVSSNGHPGLVPELVIDFVRVSNHRVFWRGQAPLILRPFHNKEEQIKPVVKQILASYPGPKGTVIAP